MKKRTIQHPDGGRTEIVGLESLYIPPVEAKKAPSLWARIMSALFGVSMVLVVAANAQNTIVSGGLAQAPGDNVYVSSNAASVAAGAGPVLSRRTVGSGKSFFVQHISASGALSIPSTATIVSLGSIQMYSNGVKIASVTFMGGQHLSPPLIMEFYPPLRISSGTVITSSATSNTALTVDWMTNFIGYEQ